MNTETTTIPLPDANTLDKLRALTAANNHTEAREVACRWLDAAWRRGNDDSWNLSPFASLHAAFLRLEEQHASAGHISPALVSLRWHLWQVVRSTANVSHLGPAWRLLDSCL